MTGHYRLIDHTADVGLDIVADDPAALFETAARALYDQLAVPMTPSGDHRRTLDVTGEDWTDLMVNWMRELLYLFNGEQQILCSVSIEAIDHGRVRAVLGCEPFAPDLHDVRNEIKAVTYHQAEAGPLEGKWRARIICDV